MEVESFESVLKSMAKNKGRQFHLLLGNGFSMAYDPKIFSYNALHTFVSQSDDTVIRKLFDIVGTRDFEQVMHQLETLASLATSFEADPKMVARIEAAAAHLKTGLIDAIRALHPEHVFRIPEQQCSTCTSFLRHFLDSGGSVFTTNYDILLYWVLMRGGLQSVDGFGRERDALDEHAPEEELSYSSELTWGKNRDGQNIHYLHGALPLFDTETEVIKEQYRADGFLLQQITRRVEGGEYPVFVTAGDGSRKLARIRRNPYLQFCYDQLSRIGGSLVTFGFNFGDQDAHILAAIKAASASTRRPEEKLWSVYIGAHSDADVERAEDISQGLPCKVHVFRSVTAPVWRLQ